MSIKELQESVLNLLHDKVTLKQDVLALTKKWFKELNEVVASEVSNLKLGLKDPRIRMEFTFKSEYESRVMIGSDALIFHLHTNVFTIPEDNPLWKDTYIKKDFSRGYFGVIYVYNFSAQSILQNRIGDEGGLLARIYINKENHFVVEGVQQVALRFPKISKNILKKDLLIEMLHLLFLGAVSNDLIIPPYDAVSGINVDQLNELSENLGIRTNKTLGFRSSSASDVEDEYT
jgi:hypothetical protein